MEAFEKYYNNSLRFLSFRPRSEKEIRDNLKKKKALPLVIEKIINKLKDKNFLNDEEFTKWWVEQRTKFQPKSLRVIKIELKQKGISQDLIGSIIQNDLERAKELVRKKLPRYQNLDKNKLYQKLGGFLARRGFDYETIKESIDGLLKKGV